LPKVLLTLIPSLSTNTILIALLHTRKDWALVQQTGIYRIPVRRAPAIVRDGTLTHIAFYFPKEFGDDAFQVKWYGEVNMLRIAPRIEAVPDEPHSPKSHHQYYLIGIRGLIPLEEPFVSLRPRRLLFIPTTEQKFFRPLAREINHLFNDSPLENLLWDAFHAQRIPAERQYLVVARKKEFVLDFAIFCKDRNINVECDGDTYHNTKPRIEHDKVRNNLLESTGWAVLRYTRDKLTYELPWVMQNITETVNRYGGVMEPPPPYTPRYLQGPEDMQGRLFE
jgi:very-short-patch-repair endonuclease